MGGSISVESRQGVGSTFTVRMPFQPGGLSSPSSPTPSSSSLCQDPLLGLSWDSIDESSGGSSSSAGLPVLPKKKKRKRRRVVRVMLNAPRKEEVFLARWEEMGCEATRMTLDTDVEELVRGADVVWTDIASLKESEGLRELLQRLNQTQVQQLDPFSHDDADPALCVVLSAREQLEGLVNDVYNLGPKIYLISRPVIMHEVVQLLDSDSLSRAAPETDAIPNGRPLEGGNLVLQPKDEEDTSGLMVLLVEDNLVGRFSQEHTKGRVFISAIFLGQPAPRQATHRKAWT
jgi:hypothetical protein